MAESSKQQLEHDIAETREELAATVAEIEARVSPTAFVRRHRDELVVAGVVSAALLVVIRIGAAVRHRTAAARAPHPPEAPTSSTTTAPTPGRSAPACTASGMHPEPPCPRGGRSAHHEPAVP